MRSPVKYVMRVHYSNENYAKYGYPGMNYPMAILATAFWIMMTGMALVFIGAACFPSLYRKSRNWHSGIPSWIEGALLITAICLVLRVLVKKGSLETNILSKAEVKRGNNYLLLYMGVLMVIFGIAAMGYLRYY